MTTKHYGEQMNAPVLLYHERRIQSMNKDEIVTHAIL